MAALVTITDVEVSADQSHAKVFFTLLGESSQVEETTRNPHDPASWGEVGRNEPCPCGSGKKYKHCHGAYQTA